MCYKGASTTGSGRRHRSSGMHGSGASVLRRLLLGTLGYSLAATLLRVALMRLLGVGWVRSLLATVAMTVGVGFIFEGLLNVVLPLGLWKITLFG